MTLVPRADADRNFGGDCDRLFATGDARRTLAPRREGDQPRRHRRLKRLDLIDAGLRAPEPGAPFAYVTTRKFLEVFGLATLRDLPDVEKLEDEGLLQRPFPETDFDDLLVAGDEDMETAD